MAAYSPSVLLLRKISVLGKWTAGSCPKGVHLMSTATKAASQTPWLMLPPRYEGSRTRYKFYSLAEDKVLAPFSSPIRNRRLTCRGSSHGWLALLSPRNLDTFLYNPISGHHIKLPSILTLPNTPEEDDLNLTPPIMSCRDIKKLILTCSPEEDEENCRAVIVNSWTNELAFCCPGRSKEWILLWDEKLGERDFEDVVYSARRKLLFGLTTSGVLETWDLRDPSSPKKTELVDVDIDMDQNFPSTSRYSFGEVIHLVVAGEQDDDLLFVFQHIMLYVGPDGLFVDHFDYERRDNLPYLTIGFEVYKYDPEKGGDLKSYSLDGLVLFLGLHSNSVAFPATQFPELKPNSIYFTDPCHTGTLEGDRDPADIAKAMGHDIGIFNYQDKTVSPCYYPCDVQSLKTIFPAPMWYFPRHSI